MGMTIMNSNKSNNSRQPELQDHDKWLSGEIGLSPSLEVREGVSPPTRGGKQRLWLPDLAWKLKSLKQFIETPEWAAAHNQ